MQKSRVHSEARKSRSSSVRRNTTRPKKPKARSRSRGWYESQPDPSKADREWAREAGKHAAPGYKEKVQSQMDDARARYRDMPSPSRSPEPRSKSKSRAKSKSKSKSRSAARSATRSPSPPDDPGERGLRQRTPLTERSRARSPEKEAYIPVPTREEQPQRERERGAKVEEEERARGWSGTGSMPAVRGSVDRSVFLSEQRDDLENRTAAFGRGGSARQRGSLSDRARKASRKNRFAGVISKRRSLSLSRLPEDVPVEPPKRSLSAVTVTSGRDKKRGKSNTGRPVTDEWRARIGAPALAEADYLMHTSAADLQQARPRPDLSLLQRGTRRLLEVAGLRSRTPIRGPAKRAKVGLTEEEVHARTRSPMGHMQPERQRKYIDAHLDPRTKLRKLSPEELEAEHKLFVQRKESIYEEQTRDALRAGVLDPKEAKGMIEAGHPLYRDKTRTSIRESTSERARRKKLQRDAAFWERQGDKTGLIEKSARAHSAEAAYRTSREESRARRAAAPEPPLRLGGGRVPARGLSVGQSKVKQQETQFRQREAAGRRERRAAAPEALGGGRVPARELSVGQSRVKQQETQFRERETAERRVREQEREKDEMGQLPLREPGATVPPRKKLTHKRAKVPSALVVMAAGLRGRSEGSALGKRGRDAPEPGAATAEVDPKKSKQETFDTQRADLAARRQLEYAKRDAEVKIQMARLKRERDVEVAKREGHLKEAERMRQMQEGMWQREMHNQRLGHQLQHERYAHHVSRRHLQTQHQIRLLQDRATHERLLSSQQQHANNIQSGYNFPRPPVTQDPEQKGAEAGDQAPPRPWAGGAAAAPSGVPPVPTGDAADSGVQERPGPGYILSSQVHGLHDPVEIGTTPPPQEEKQDEPVQHDPVEIAKTPPPVAAATLPEAPVKGTRGISPSGRFAEATRAGVLKVSGPAPITTLDVGKAEHEADKTKPSFAPIRGLGTTGLGMIDSPEEQAARRALPKPKAVRPRRDRRLSSFIKNTNATVVAAGLKNPVDKPPKPKVRDPKPVVRDEQPKVDVPPRIVIPSKRRTKTDKPIHPIPKVHDPDPKPVIPLPKRPIPKVRDPKPVIPLPKRPIPKVRDVIPSKRRTIPVQPPPPGPVPPKTKRRVKVRLSESDSEYSSTTDLSSRHSKRSVHSYPSHHSSTTAPSDHSSRHSRRSIHSSVHPSHHSSDTAPSDHSSRQSKHSRRSIPSIPTHYSDETETSAPSDHSSLHSKSTHPSRSTDSPRSSSSTDHHSSTETSHHHHSSSGPSHHSSSGPSWKRNRRPPPGPSRRLRSAGATGATEGRALLALQALQALLEAAAAGLVARRARPRPRGVWPQEQERPDKKPRPTRRRSGAAASPKRKSATPTSAR